ncbi:type IV pilus assembly protein PilC [Thermoanaerobacter uzonensis DSM 18761]|uniref:Type IV pilus assembly protein PilC n=1 Tax=Thermoanaerobacter uzonensis DSM 18761 TaxID=1123369 RepID=A0A1M4VAF1_9THEO|nr:type II secretion system F family protein [Thermoanaerobacter uzonensis]SHE65944.1 type IV pilus assembly protein PilC [Thermoanaerobacter uzonensis DSM 18761]
MPLYAYRARDMGGNLVTGTLEVDSKSQCIDVLKQKNYYIIDIKEEIVKQDILDFGSFKKVKIKDIAVFCRQFATLINAGITIVTALATMKEQVENKRLKKAISEVYEEVQKGKTLSDAMKKHGEVFPMLLYNMVEVGEVSGTLDKVMNEMADHYEKENDLNQKVKSALTYPLIVSVVAVLVVIFLLTNVLPIFVGMFKNAGVQLPLPTRILIAISSSISQYWYFYTGGIFLISYSISSFLKTPEGRRIYDRMLLNMPIFGSLNRKILTSRFTRTLGTLINAGIPLIAAMEVVEKVVGNIVVAEGLKKAQEDIKKGLPLSDPLKRIGIFPPMVIQMISIGESSGSLDSILNKTADFYDGEVDTAVSQMTTLLEPLIIVILATVVGFIVISIVMPLFQLYNFIGQ